MRGFAVVGALALSMAALQATSAAAQAGSPTSDLLDRATRASPAMLAGSRLPSAFSQLSRPARDLIKAEGERQAQTPRTPDEVSDTLSQALAPELIRIARTQGVNPQDVSNALLLVVMVNAEDLVAKDLKKVRKTSVATDGERVLQYRLALATANRKAVMKALSQESMELLM